jgi:hypothetical protein
MSGRALWRLDPTTYVAHDLHRGERAWPESNCYTDLWIEVLHALGLDPSASLGYTLAIDFEGDQWTFFKPPLGDLFRLYGIDVQELNLWKALPEHLEEQISRGRMVIVDADAYFLPDTAGMSYRTEHTKTAIGVQEIDAQAQRLGYFHNGGYYALEGEDYRGQFRFGEQAPSLPPYCEFAKFDSLRRRPAAELAAESHALARFHFARRPRANPMTAYKERFPADVESLMREPLAVFHLYAFSTLRQLGACAELCAHYLRWLQGNGQGELEPAARELEAVAGLAKALQFKVARAVNTKKPIDVSTLTVMESSWGTAHERLATHFGA